MTRRNCIGTVALIAVIFCAAGKGVAAEYSNDLAPCEISDVEGIEGGGLFLDGRTYISGQPNASALADLVGRGLQVVVNVRTPEENTDREDIPFDEARAVEGLGIAYVEIPLGGDYSYDPTAVARLAEILQANEGQVLIHCGYGSRAAYLWLAYLVEHEGLQIDQAMARGEGMMLKQHPMGRLLGRPTTLIFVEEKPVPS